MISLPGTVITVCENYTVQYWETQNWYRQVNYEELLFESELALAICQEKAEELSVELLQTYRKVSYLQAQKNCDKAWLNLIFHYL